MNGNNVIELNQELTQLTLESITKIAILGAESTGKTTLCRDLAAHFDSLWVAEYMRTYLQKKWDETQLACTWEDLLPIAQGQIELENSLALQAQQRVQNATDTPIYLFCDTSLFELMVYSHWYYDDCPPALTTAALIHHYDLVLFTEDDIPWVADDLRDSPYQRHEINAYFESQLNTHNKAYKRIGGSRKERVVQVADWISSLKH